MVVTNFMRVHLSENILFSFYFGGQFCYILSKDIKGICSCYHFKFVILLFSYLCSDVSHVTFAMVSTA